MKIIKDSETQRAVSITTGFILNIGIATVAVSVLLFTLQGYFTGLQDDTKETELRVVGERITWELEKADRMVREGDTGEVVIETDDVGQYDVRIQQNSVVLSSGSASVNVSHDVESNIDGTPVNLTGTGGQEYLVGLNEPTDGEMRVR